MLVHVLVTIAVDIIPFLILLFVLWVGFALALAFLFQIQTIISPQVRDGDGLAFPEQAGWPIVGWMYCVMNMGLYGHLDDGSLLLLHENVTICVVYAAFMFVVHLVLLNLLIAIMQFS